MTFSQLFMAFSKGEQDTLCMINGGTRSAAREISIAIQKSQRDSTIEIGGKLAYI